MNLLDLGDSPLVTFSVFAYNQESYIGEAVLGALSQTYEPLQIILSDDCSQDATFQVMKNIVDSYSGPHHVILRQNRNNIGLAAHVNCVLNMAEGEIVILSAGDDVSYSSRTSTSVHLLQSNLECSAVLVSADIIDSTSSIIGTKLLSKKRDGITTQDLDMLIKNRAITFGAGRAIRKSAWNNFPQLSEKCPTEDTPLLLRTLISGPNILSSKKELAYRKHGNNLSRPESIRRMSLINISRQYQSDVMHAASIDMVNVDTRDNLLRWVQKNHQLRLIEIKLLGKSFLSKFEIIFVILSPFVSFVQKKHILLRTSKLLFSRLGLC